MEYRRDTETERNRRKSKEKREKGRMMETTRKKV